MVHDSPSFYSLLLHWKSKKILFSWCILDLGLGLQLTLGEKKYSARTVWIWLIWKCIDFPQQE